MCNLWALFRRCSKAGWWPASALAVVKMFKTAKAEADQYFAL